MRNSREWDVTVRGRIEDVTDQEAFPKLFRATLAQEDGISIARFGYPTWPHTTSAVIRISASSKRDAERVARDIALPVFQSVARTIIGDKAFGWTLGVDAVPASQVSS
ncbi:MAG: hypothetical protein HKL85_07565 [Acidimicrobiaceae bacterium]|nr:hypothetical protein [Acidimicrobiaceae bacterium]